MTRQRKVIAYIDGFNLYHAVRELRSQRLKWCDVRSLVSGFLGPSETLHETRYYTAYPKHLDKNVRRRFNSYTMALEATGVRVIKGAFKKKDNTIKIDKIKPPLTISGDKRTHIYYKSHEEKETDVHLSVDLVGDAYENRYDKALVVSRDSDIFPSIRYVIDRLYPAKRIMILYPPSLSKDKKRRVRPRLGAEYDNLYQFRNIKKKDIVDNLLPDELIGKDGAPVKIPPEYLQSRAD